MTRVTPESQSQVALEGLEWWVVVVGNDTRQVWGVYKERVPEASQRGMTPRRCVDSTPKGGTRAPEATLGRDRLGVCAQCAQQHGQTIPRRTWSSLWIKHVSAGCWSLRG